MEHNKVSSDQVYTLDQVAKHSTESDCWVVVNGQVLDVTSFLGEHPGGKDAILMFAGKDATEEFNMLHKPDTVETHAPRVIIGRVGTPSQKVMI
jgi:cytochrome b involved in lipid metabolism